MFTFSESRNSDSGTLPLSTPSFRIHFIFMKMILVRAYKRASCKTPRSDLQDVVCAVGSSEKHVYFRALGCCCTVAGIFKICGMQCMPHSGSQLRIRERLGSFNDLQPYRVPHSIASGWRAHAYGTIGNIRTVTVVCAYVSISSRGS